MQNAKKFIWILAGALCAVILAFLLATHFRSSPTTPSEEALSATEIGTSTYTCVTTASEVTTQESPEGTIQSKTFSHNIYDAGGTFIATLHSDVTGILADESASITSISSNLSETAKSGMTLSEHISGNTATIIVYINNLSICYFQYRLHGDGTLELL